MLFNLENINWIIPGFLFIYFCNKHRPINKTYSTGWPFFFLIICISSFLHPFIKTLTHCFISFFNSKFSSLTADDFFLTIYLIFSIILVILVYSLLHKFFQSKFSSFLSFLSTSDNFLENCIKWSNKSIFLTLKNDCEKTS